MQVDVYGDTLCALVSATALASTGNQVQLHLPAGPHAEQLLVGSTGCLDFGLPGGC